MFHMTIAKGLSIFTSIDSDIYRLTLYGFSIYSLAFMIMGIGIFSSTLFTAFLDGKTSAVISFSKTFIFIVGSIWILRNIIGTTGLWTAILIAELLRMFIAIFYLIKKKLVIKYIDIFCLNLGRYY